MEDLVPSIAYFDKNWQRFKERDINRYTAKSLEDVVKDTDAKKSIKSIKEEDKLSGAEKIAERDNVLLLWIKNKKGSVCYGAGTRWCITMDSANYFEDYSDKNVIFYFLIDKNKTQEDDLYKVALAVYRKNDNSVRATEIFDAQDEKISWHDLTATQFALASITRKDAPTRPLPPSLFMGNLPVEEVEKILNSHPKDVYYAFFHQRIHPNYFQLIFKHMQDKLTVERFVNNLKNGINEEQYSSEEVDKIRMIFDKIAALSPSNEILKLLAGNVSHETTIALMNSPSKFVRAQVAKHLGRKDEIIAMFEEEIQRPGYYYSIFSFLINKLKDFNENNLVREWRKRIEQKQLEEENYEVLMPIREIFLELSKLGKDEIVLKTYICKEDGLTVIERGDLLEDIVTEYEGEFEAFKEHGMIKKRRTIQIDGTTKDDD